MCARAKQTRRIGWIGLGTMGLPMALRLADKSGCAVHGCDIVPAAMDAFASMGGIPEPDGAALLDMAEAAAAQAGFPLPETDAETLDLVRDLLQTFLTSGEP